MAVRNAMRMRKDNNKPGPSGMSRNTAYALPEKWGGRACLMPVDVDVIRGIKESMGGDALLAFTSAVFDQRAQIVYDSLAVVDLNFDNVWDVFTAMYPLVFP